jgi:hypothetical protein
MDENPFKEVTKAGYFEHARQRAQRRKSLWNIILLPLGFGGAVLCAYALFRCMWQVHITLYPDHIGRLREFWGKNISTPSFISSFLLFIPLLFAGFVLGLMLANCIAWGIAPARRAFDREAQGAKGTSFLASQRGLWVIAKIVVPVCLLLSFIGAATLRSLR